MENRNYGEDKSRPFFTNGHEYRWFDFGRIVGDEGGWVRVQFGTATPELVGGLYSILRAS